MLSTSKLSRAAGACLLGAALLAGSANLLPAQDAKSQDSLRVHVNPGTGAVTADKFEAYPRYFTNTNDTLIRQSEDAARNPNPNGANAGITPGLAKNNYITKLYPVYNTDAVNLQVFLLRALAYEGGIVEVMGNKGVKDGAGKDVQFLVVTAPDFMVPGLDELVSKADVKGFQSADGTETFEYRGKHRTAGELKSILVSGELGNVGGFYYAPLADPTLNTVYFADSPADMPANKAILEAFDRPPLQAELEVRVIEIDNDNLSDLGVDWDAWKRSISGGLTYSSIGSAEQFFDDKIDSFDTLLSVDAATLAEFLNYTVQTGKAEVVTSSKVLSVNAEDNPGALSGGNKGNATATPALFKSVRYLPYSTYVPTTSVLPDGSTVTSGRTLTDVLNPDMFEGIQVSVTPFIATESVTADISVTVNSLLGYTKETRMPNIASRESRNVVNMKSGQMALLGAFDKITTTESRVGIPLLKDIPVLKYLFSRETAAKRGSKLVVFLSAKIMDGSKGETQDLPADMTSRIDATMSSRAAK